jgi:recombinational DNA repair ATPase RecF
MTKHGFMLNDGLQKAGRTRASIGSSKAAAGRKAEDQFVGFTPEEQSFVDGMAKHRRDFSATAVVARSESHRKNS